MEALVKTQHISKTFMEGDAPSLVLKDITLEIAAGQLTMLVGPSGCGKTTLLSIIAGILTPSEGQVTVAGTNITDLSEKERTLFRRTILGFIFQQFNLLPALTAAENAAIPLIAAGQSYESAISAATAILEQMGMGEHCHKYPRHLSGGQQQRVAIARALVHQPKVIVCDEPTSSLDAHAGQQVLEILRHSAIQPDCAVIVVTHDNRIYHFADTIISMNDGRITKGNDKKDA